jgi:hypothetical protein
MSAEFKPIWMPTNNTEGFGKTQHFLRRSEILETGKNSSFQVAIISPNGFVPTNETLHFGYASGNMPIKFLFPRFGSPMHTQMSLSVGYENSPKIGKRVSGDMVASIVMFERDGSTRNISVLNMVVDNLTTKSGDTYGLLNLPADGYAAGCARDALIIDPNKYLEYFESTRLLKPVSGEYGMNGMIVGLPQDTLELRNSTLGLVSDQLPISEITSEKFRGVYGITLSRFKLDPISGATGSCVAIRSKADVKVNINNKIELDTDNHRPAQVIANLLDASTEDAYRAKLGAHIYDTTGSSYIDNVGEFEVVTFDPRISDGEVSNFVGIESDGYKVGNEADDASRLMMYFYAIA